MVTIFIRCALGLLFSFLPLKQSMSTVMYPTLESKVTLPTVTITAKKIIKKHVHKAKEFMGLICEQPLDTRVHDDFKLAMNEYTGPKVKLTSLRRHKNNRSKHNIGKAADFQFSDELINWLLSEEGTA